MPADAQPTDAKPADAKPVEGTGTIAGQVVDASSGDPIIEAGVEILGVQKQIRTDLDGRYSVKVPAGTYAVRFFAPLYEGARIEKVVVEAGKVFSVQTLPASLKPCIEPLVKQISLPATRIAKRETLHHTMSH
jgi:hypothetical protein